MYDLSLVKLSRLKALRKKNPNKLKGFSATNRHSIHLASPHPRLLKNFTHLSSISYNMARGKCAQVEVNLNQNENNIINNIIILLLRHKAVV